MGDEGDGRKGRLPERNKGTSFIWDSRAWTPEGPSVPCTSWGEAQRHQWFPGCPALWLSLGDQQRSRTPHSLQPSPGCLGLYSPCMDPEGSTASPAITGLAWLAVEAGGLIRTAQECTALPKGHAQEPAHPVPSEASESPHASAFSHGQPCPRRLLAIRCFMRRAQPPSFPPGEGMLPRGTRLRHSLQGIFCVLSCCPFGCLKRTFLGCHRLGV